MEEYIKKICKYLIIGMIGIMIGILFSKFIFKSKKPITKIEYVQVHDTITVDKERIINHTKIINHKDTIIKVLNEVDTIIDSVFIILPIEYKEYLDTIKSDSIETVLKINYHGVHSSIDSIYLNNNYYKQREIIIQKPKKIGLDFVIGPYFGYGLHNEIDNINHGFQVGIGISIGLGYRITK